MNTLCHCSNCRPTLATAGQPNAWNCKSCGGAVLATKVEAMLRELEQAAWSGRECLIQAQGELAKANGLEAGTTEWPEWTPQANTIRWVENLLPAGVARRAPSPSVKRLTYLACPYTHPDRGVREARFNTANAAAAALMKKGELVFSPISHGHPIALQGDLPVDWSYWGSYCRAILVACDRVVVLEVDGCRESVGVNAEVALAREMGLSVEYQKPEEVG